jgi:hypothetical protein
VPGDLQSVLYAPGGDFYEADMDAPGRGKPTFRDRKIDYVFASHRHFARNLSAEIRERASVTSRIHARTTEC